MSLFRLDFNEIKKQSSFLTPLAKAEIEINDLNRLANHDGINTSRDRTSLPASHCEDLMYDISIIYELDLKYLKQ